MKKIFMASCLLFLTAATYATTGLRNDNDKKVDDATANAKKVEAIQQNVQQQYVKIFTSCGVVVDAPICTVCSDDEKIKESQTLGAFYDAYYCEGLDQVLAMPI